jgi:hypothetical protein
MTDPKRKRFLLHLPEDLYAEIEKIAQEEMRSVTAQIVVLLRDAVARRKAMRGKDRKSEEQIRTPEPVPA